MLNEKRINEARSNVNTYLTEGLIKKETFKDIIFKTYLNNHRESLLVADKLFNENISNLWVVVISYYSMFYIANALLYKIGSKIAHKITADSLIHFVRDKLKDNLIEEYEIANGEASVISDNLLENFDYERLKRSVFQYESTEKIKRAKAETSLKRAKEFSKEIEKLF